MIGFGRDFQHLQFDVGAQGSKEMVGLSGDSFGGRLGQGSILLEGLVIGFHVPSFAIESGDGVVSEVEITGDQIQDTDTAIFVCKDLFDQMELEINPFKVNGQHAIRFNVQCIHALVTTLLFVLKAQGDFAIAFQRHHKITIQLVFNEHHVVGRSEPDIIKYIAKWDLIVFDLPQQVTIHLILAHWRTPLFLLGLLVNVELGFVDQMIIHWQRDIAHMIQRRDEIDPFDILPSRVIIVPANDVILIRMRLFRDAVINDDDTIFCLYLSDIGFHRQPQVFTRLRFLRQKSLYPIMANLAIQQARQPRLGCQSERTDEIICIYIEQFFFVHTPSLPHFELCYA